MTDPLWVNRKQAAQICASNGQPEGLSVQHFDSTIRPLLGAEDWKGGRKGLSFRASAVVAAWVAYRLARDVKPDSDGDPLLAGEGSGALERYRLAKAIEQEKKNAVTDRTLIRRDEIEPALLQFAGTLGDAGDILQRQHGPDAAEILNDALDDFRMRVREVLRRYDPNDGQSGPDGVGPDGGAGAPSPLAIHAGVRGTGNRNPGGVVRGPAVQMRKTAV